MLLAHTDRITLYFIGFFSSAKWNNIILNTNQNHLSYIDYEYATENFGDNASNTFSHINIDKLSLSANGFYLTNSSDLVFSNDSIDVEGNSGIYIKWIFIFF